MRDEKFSDMTRVIIDISNSKKNADEPNKLYKEFENLSDILLFLENNIPFIRKYNKDTNPSITYYYRGQSEVHEVIPSIFRKEAYCKKEKYIFDAARAENPRLMDNRLSNFDRLSIMQHNGYPTRLLDITNNALNATFFACSELDKSASIYIFKGQDPNTESKKSNHILYSNGDTAKVISAIAQLSYDDQYSLYKYCTDHTESEKLNCSDGNEFTKNLYQAIRKEDSSFTDDVLISDILKPHMIIPMQSDPRIAAQRGAFIVPGLSFTKDRQIDKNDIEQQILSFSLRLDNDKNHNQPIRLTFKEDKLKEIILELSKIGIDAGSIYLDMDHKSNAFKNSLLKSFKNDA